MTDEAVRAVVMDAPRILRKDLTATSEWMAKYVGLAAACGGNETFAHATDAIEAVVRKLAELRGQLELSVEALNHAAKPQLGADAGSPEMREDAMTHVFALEDVLIAWTRENNKVPQAIEIRPDVRKLLEEHWPGQTTVRMGKQAVEMRTATEGTEAPFTIVP